MINNLMIQLELQLAKGENVKKVKPFLLQIVVVQLVEQSTNDP